MRQPKDYILLYVKGLCMGGADVIPGVSGGTIAFITGIYEELLHSLKSIDLTAFTLLRKFQFAAFWQQINGNFLATVLAGIATSAISMAKVLSYLLDKYPIMVWSFFFGLILISSPLILRTIKRWRIGVIVAFIVGAGVAYTITILSPTQTPEALWFIFFAGCFAICAMILPGISGAFILLLLGKYEFIIRSLLDVNLAVIVVFIIGCVAGLVSFSHLLTWILDHYHDLTIALLAGFMIGSLNKVWPWKEVLSFRINSNGQQVAATDRSILPWDYLTITGHDPQVFQAIMMAASGVFIVVVIEKIAERFKTKF